MQSTKPNSFFMSWALFSVLLLSASISSSRGAVEIYSDDFNDNSKNTSKWGTDFDFEDAGGTLTETSQRLQFTSISTGFITRVRPWTSTSPTYNQDWEMIVDVVNNRTFSTPSDGTSIGIAVQNPNNPSQLITAEIYAYNSGNSAKGFLSSMLNNGNETGAFDTPNLGASQGQVRLTFDSTSKVIRAYYKTTGPWFEIASYGISAAGGGSTGNLNWGMNSASTFKMAVYGFSGDVAVSAGQVYADNFQLALNTQDTSAPSVTFTEDFSAGSFSGLRWKPRVSLGGGVVSVANQRAEFVVSSPSGDEDAVYAPWNGPLPVDKDWEAVLTVNNSHTIAGLDPNSSVGLTLKHPITDEVLFIELVSYGGGSRSFLSSAEENFQIFGEVETFSAGVTHARMRINYNATTKVVTTSYDKDGLGSIFGWTAHASFGLAGSGGGTANRNWNLSPTSKFVLGLSFYSELTTVGSGLIWSDDFSLSISGYVPPSLQISPDAGNVRITWPSAENVYFLQSCNSLNSPVWTPVGNQPQTSGSDLSVTLPAGSSASFFRLFY